METTTVLADVIRKNKNITRVSLINCNLDNDTIEIMMNAIIENKNIVELNLISNKLSYRGAYI